MSGYGALELSALIRAKKLGVVEVVGAYIDEIEKTGEHYNAFLSVTKEQALARAAAIQARIDSGGDLPPLAGVPVGIKDNISTAGIETTCASRMLAGYAPVFNATVVDKLEQSGMIVVGKLNMDEFAMGGSSETGISGPVRNPWDTSRVAGGSSGGSAAAVASRQIPLSLGSDTGGSIRQPCSFCGVTGIKPTYGSVSRSGLIAYASSLDQIGPIGQNIDDCAAMLEVISGPDEKDSTCIAGKPFDFGFAGRGRLGVGLDGVGLGDGRLDGGRSDGMELDCAQSDGGWLDGGRSDGGWLDGGWLDGGRLDGGQLDGTRLDGARVGIPRNYFEGGIEEDVKQAVLAAAQELGAAGADIEDFNMPLLDYMIPAYYVIACAEASSNLSRFDGLKYGYRSPGAESLSGTYRLSRSEGFGLEVKRRIMLGSFVLSSGYFDAFYQKALQARELIKEAYDKLFEKYDMILSPVAPTTAYKIGEKVDDPMKMYMGDIYTVSVNLAGLPAVALPCGFDRQGLPIGLQLVGDAFSEKKLIDAARVYQARTDWHKKRPTADRCVPGLL